jgi:hypothetical protein
MDDRGLVRVRLLVPIPRLRRRPDLSSNLALPLDEVADTGRSRRSFSRSLRILASVQPHREDDERDYENGHQRDSRVCVDDPIQSGSADEDDDDVGEDRVSLVPTHARSVRRPFSRDNATHDPATGLGMCAVLERDDASGNRASGCAGASSVGPPRHCFSILSPGERRKRQGRRRAPYRRLPSGHFRRTRRCPQRTGVA